MAIFCASWDQMEVSYSWYGKAENESEAIKKWRQYVQELGINTGQPDILDVVNEDSAYFGCSALSPKVIDHLKTFVKWADKALTEKGMFIYLPPYSYPI